MPIYRVVELYPQSVVRRVLTVKAPSLADARMQPHEHEVLRDYYAIDEGGEARTESAKCVAKPVPFTLEETARTLQQVEGVLASFRDRKLLGRHLANALIYQCRTSRARLACAVLAEPWT